MAECMQARPDPVEFLGDSAAARRLRNEIAQLGRFGFRSALIIGETGVGKDLVARQLARGGIGARASFEVFNCPAVPIDHLESELFGTARGAFPGALDRAGAAERADGGVLFLDEVAALSLHHQAKVLRFLESGEARRLGATRAYRSRASVIAATNEDLVSHVGAGRFREDLYYRLVQDGVVHVPPLRERIEDIVLLARHFASGLDPDGAIGDEAAAELRNHDWPGNARELRAVVRHAVRRSDGAVAAGDIQEAISRIGLRPEPPKPGPATEGAPVAAGFRLAGPAEQRRQLLEAIRTTRGNRTLAGVLLGFHRRLGEQGEERPLDLQARKRAYRKFQYWWCRRVGGEAVPPEAAGFAA